MILHYLVHRTKNKKKTVLLNTFQNAGGLTFFGAKFHKNQATKNTFGQ